MFLAEEGTERKGSDMPVAFKPNVVTTFGAFFNQVILSYLVRVAARVLRIYFFRNSSSV